MPTLRFRKRAIDRLLTELKLAGEVGLAFFLTAGVASCGGQTATGGSGGGKDSGVSDASARPDIGAVIEAAQFDGPIPQPEAAQQDTGVAFEAAQFDAQPEAAQFDAQPEAALVEGGVADAGRADTGIFIEAAQGDAGAGGH